MQIEATKKPLRYRLKSGQEILLRPGCPVDLPEPSARRLLEKAGAQVRLVDVVVEPASATAKPVYFQQADRIVGPCIPEYLGRLGDRFFVFVQYDGQCVPIDSDRLRSRQQFEAQRDVITTPARKEPAP